MRIAAIMIILPLLIGCMVSPSRNNPFDPNAVNFLGYAGGSNWTRIIPGGAFDRKEGATLTVYKSRLWLIAGYLNPFSTNNVYSSPDGVSWTLVTANAAFAPRYMHTTVVFKDKLWVIAGSASNPTNDVWYSTDGAAWTFAGIAGFTNRSGHSSVVFNDRIWVIGGQTSAGNSNDVWYSSDGTSWTQALAAAPFTNRKNHSMIVFNNKMWVIGGETMNYTNDVWSSPDGVSWTLAKAQAPFIARAGHASFAYNGRMWVIGGKYSAGPPYFTNDVWSSLDGAAWAPVSTSAPFPIRYNPGAAIFRSTLWLAGGLASSGASATNDVWMAAYGK